MGNLATSSLAPFLGQHVPLRGPARLLFRSYTKVSCEPGKWAQRLTTRFGDDFDVDLSSNLEWQIYAFGAFEEHFAALFRHLVQPGDRCIDVGANVGYHTIRLAKLVGEDGEVIAIEPDEDMVCRAANNLKLNHLENVRLIKAAASDCGESGAILYRPDAKDTNKGLGSL